VRELDLCDCERALGTPHGLTCEKQGYFVTGFENEGSWVRTSVCIRTCHIMPPKSIRTNTVAMQQCTLPSALRQGRKGHHAAPLTSGSCDEA